MAHIKFAALAKQSRKPELVAVALRQDSLSTAVLLVSVGSARVYIRAAEEVAECVLMT